jgi:hypothetical protein
VFDWYFHKALSILLPKKVRECTWLNLTNRDEKEYNAWISTMNDDIFPNAHHWLCTWHVYWSLPTYGANSAHLSNKGNVYFSLA